MLQELKPNAIHPGLIFKTHAIYAGLILKTQGPKTPSCPKDAQRLAPSLPRLIDTRDAELFLLLGY